MTAPHEIIQLVEKFDYNRDAYLSGRYNETQLRREFIDPFFEVLGWDISNKQGWAEAYKDVIHEDAIKVGSATKAPDYCFRIGGTRKFFIEAKKPSIDIKDAIAPAYQVRRYAWSAKLPLSILTDFEEFAVYDCRIKPTPSDKASTARTIYATYNEYPQRWDEIASIFSRQAVLKGSFDKYVESNKTKKGTTEVDNAFLEEIEYWRDLLARHLALRNSNLTQRELNSSVQRIIDRIIFLRICEDRGIESYGQLRAAANSTSIYPELCRLFHQADDRYNSGLFHFRREKGRLEQPDGLTPTLTIDDKPLAQIIESLYYPESPYEFSVLPADILGQVYEQFLGKVIRLTSGHRATVEDKPEVKKAGGVYYTPTYIVDYIVKNTVGKLVEGKTPKEVANLRILDPACGSGSFLIGVYQYLLEWHRDWYVNDGPKKWARGRSATLYQARASDWRLTSAERKRVLLDSIYGVDIDTQAVEVTKLSLLLKVLEGESEQTLNSQLALLQERALPDLGNNIKCGNSLISLDFYESQQMSFFGEDERYIINAFDWQTEFPEIMKAGGFDSVIGNPPWVFTRDVSFGESAKEYFARHYVGASGKVNLYALFIYRGISLLNNTGWFSMIVPNTFLRATTYKPLREYMLQEWGLELITDTGSDVFRGVTASTIVVLLSKLQQVSKVRVATLEESGAEVQVNTIEQDRLLANPGVVIDLYAYESTRDLIDRVRSQCKPLSDYVTHLISGIQTWKQHKSNFIADRLVNREYKPLLEGKDIGRYRLAFGQKYIWYSKKALNVLQDEEIFLLPEKILIQRVSGGNRPLRATLDRCGYYCFNSINTLVCHDIDNRFVLGILNSTFMNWFYSVTFSNRSQLTVNIANRNLEQLPIRPINLSDPVDKKHHDHMVQLVEHMLSLHEQLAMLKTDHDKMVIQRQISATDRQIDLLVYELYRLGEDEIETVKRETMIR